MKIRLQEIELGTNDPDKSKLFYSSILGLEISVDQVGLNVFQSGVTGVDFNTSTHFPHSTTVTSFLTDNLQNVIDRLSANGIVFSGPKKSHLGMTTIEFNDPDGYLIRVNQPTEESPTWLRV
jgi:predicted enzyme related to lactoylglutathione lyase